MNSRYFITQRYGGVLNAMRQSSQLAAVIHALDVKAGERGTFVRGYKNPFRGIAHTNGSSYSPRYFRHVEGARDWRPKWGNSRHYASNDGSFRDANPVPAGFCE